MKPRRKEAYHHGDLRRTLLDASLDLLREEGVGALSLREVARRAGVTHAAPYHHFADRGALLRALADEGFVLLRDEMRREMAAASPAPAAQLAASGVGYVTFALRHPAHFRVMFRPELCALRGPSRAGTTAYDVLVEAVAACERAGLVPAGRTDAVVLAAWSLVHGLASLWIDGPLALELGPPEAARPAALIREVTALLPALLERATSPGSLPD